MPYKHFGRIGDVWKHLPLCEILKIEKPGIYVETNSAYPQYRVKNDWRFDYGINRFLKNAGEMENTEYFRLENAAILDSNYLGSPALAMKILGESCREYHLFDIENEALSENINFAGRISLKDKIFTHNTDSRNGLRDLFQKLGSDSFIHIDPYMIFDLNYERHSYADLFVGALERNIKVLLWYGFNFSYEKLEINEWAEEIITMTGCDKARLFEIEIDGFKKYPAAMNPGIIGCGIIAANMSPESFDRLEDLYKFILKIYADVEVINDYHFNIKGFSI